MSNLNNLREVMKKENVDYYIIPSGDSHQSEYVPDHEKRKCRLLHNSKWRFTSK